MFVHARTRVSSRSYFKQAFAPYFQEMRRTWTFPEQRLFSCQLQSIIIWQMYGPTGGGKKFATNCHFTFSAEFLTPPSPPISMLVFRNTKTYFFDQGDVRPEKSSQPKSMLRSSNIEIWGSGGIIGCRSVCFNSINGVRPHSQSRRLRTFFLLLSGGSVYM